MVGTRFGVTIRLLAGIVGMVLLTLAACVTAILALGAFKGSFDRVASSQLDTMVAATELGRQSESLIGLAPALLLSRGEDDRRAVMDEVAEQRRRLDELVVRLGAAAASRDAIAARQDALVDSVRAIDRLVARRLATEGALRSGLERFLALFQQARTTVDARLIDLDRAIGAPGPAAAERDRLLAARAAEERLLLLLVGLVAAPDATAAAARSDAATAELVRLGDLLSASESPAFLARITALHARMRAIATGPGGLLVNAGRRAAQDAEGRALVTENRDAADRLSGAVAALIATVRDDVLATNRALGEALARERERLSLLAALCAAAGGAIAVSVHRRVVRRLRRLQDGMRRVTEGQAADFHDDGRDEIADLAGAAAFVVRELRRRERAIADSEARFRGLIEGSIQGILVHRAFRPLFANDAYARLHGYANGADVVALDSLRPLVAPEERARSWARYFRAMAGRPTGGVTRTRSLRRDGTPVTVETIDRVVEWMGAPAVQTTVVDVSDRVRAEAVAAEAAAQLRAAIEAMPSAMIMCDDDLGIRVFNRRYSDYWNLPPEVIERHRRMDELLRYGVENGYFPGVDADRFVEQRIGFMRRNEPYSQLFHTVEGRDLELRGSPRPEGGWVITITDVSDRTRAVRAMRESEARFRDLVEGSVQGILILRDGRARYVNPAFAAMVGHPDPSGLEGCALVGTLVPPDDAEQVAAWRRLLADAPSPAQGDGDAVPSPDAAAGGPMRRARLRRGDGALIWVDVVTRAIDWMGEAAVQVTAVDVTRQVEAEAAVAARTAQLQALFDTMPTGVAMFDASRRLVLHNRRFADLWHFPEALTAQGPTLGTLMRAAAERGDLPAAEAEAEAERVAVLARGGAARDHELALAGGPVLGIRAAAMAGGGHILTYTDVSEWRRAEDALRQAKNQAEEAARAKSTFLATMSHEIRTPMNGVLGMLEVLDRTRLDREQRAVLGVVRESASSLLTIIDDILDFSRIEAGRLRLETVAVTVGAVVEGVAELMAPRAQEKGLDLTARVALDGGGRRIGDPVRLRQILLNLVGNAIKFTERGHVAIRARPGAADGLVRFEVEDSGIGLSPEQQAGLFQPFTQADDSTTRRFGGSGLGLSICRRLVELMGGRIGVDGAPGRGSTFWFEVPLPAARGEPADMAGAAVEPDAGAPGPAMAPPARDEALAAGTLILVAEDNPTNQVVIRKQLEQLGFAADLAVDGDDAWQALQRHDYGLLLTDCSMPAIDGYELARRVRERERATGHRLPIVALTANALTGEAERCRAAGMDDYLSKPVSLQRLSRAIGRWLPQALRLRRPRGEDVPAVEADHHRPGGDGDAVVLDLAHVAATFGSVEAARDLLALFLETTGPLIDAVAAGLAAGDADAGRRAAHAAGGAARTAGATELAEVCARVEAAAAGGDVAAALGDTAHLRGAFERVGKLIRGGI